MTPGFLDPFAPPPVEHPIVGSPDTATVAPLDGNESHAPAEFCDPSVSAAVETPGENPRSGSRASWATAAKDRTLWFRALRTAALGYAAAVLAAIVLGLSLVIGGSSALTSSLGRGVLPTSGAGGFAPDSLVAIVLQLVSMSFGSPASTSVTMWGASAQISVWFMPLLVPIASMATVWWWTRRYRSQGATHAALAVFAGATGVIFATGTLLFAVVVPWTVTAGVQLTVRAVSPVGWLVALVLVGLAAWLGAQLRVPIPAAWAAAGWGALTHLGGLTLVAGLYVLVTMVSKDAIWALPAAGLNVALMGDVVALLGTVTMSGQLGTIIPGASGGYGQGLSLFTPGVSGWLWLGVGAAALLAAGAALVLYLRGGATGPITVARTAGVWAAVGLTIQLLTGMGISIAVGGIVAKTGSDASGSGTLGPSTVTFMMFALWGAVVGAAAVWIAPRVAPIIPARLIAFAQTGLVVTPASASGEVLAPATAVSGTGGAVSLADAAGGPSPARSQHSAVPQMSMMPVQPMSRRTKVVAGVAVGAIAAIVAAAIVIPILRSNVFGPQTVVRNYMAALEAGDADHALALSGSSRTNGSEGALLTNEIYGKATNRPSNAGIDKVTVTGDTATVLVSYRAGDQAQQAVLTATRTSTAWLVADHWTLLGGLAVGRLSVGLDDPSVARDVQVNGTTLADKVTQKTTYVALPGTYQVQVPGTTLFQGDSAALNVQPGASPSMTVRLKATTAFTTAATDAATKSINECAAKTDSSINDTCPFTANYYVSKDISNVSYKIITMPTWTFGLVSDGTWRVSSATSGKVHIKYDENWFGTTSTRETDDSFSANYKVDPSADGTVTVTYTRW